MFDADTADAMLIAPLSAVYVDVITILIAITSFISLLPSITLLMLSPLSMPICWPLRHYFHYAITFSAYMLPPALSIHAIRRYDDAAYYDYCFADMMLPI